MKEKELALDEDLDLLQDLVNLKSRNFEPVYICPRCGEKFFSSLVCWEPTDPCPSCRSREDWV